MDHSTWLILYTPEPQVLGCSVHKGLAHPTLTADQEDAPAHLLTGRAHLLTGQFDGEYSLF